MTMNNQIVAQVKHKSKRYIVLCEETCPACGSDGWAVDVESDDNLPPLDDCCQECEGSGIVWRGVSLQEALQAFGVVHHTPIRPIPVRKMK